MEYLAATVSVAQSLLGALQSSELKELCSVWGYESELENLECTMVTIKAVLLDAESKQEQGELSNQTQSWVDQLKLAVYDADDLLDEFITIAEQKRRRAKDMKRDNLAQKVRRFFSFDNPVLVALRLSQGVKGIRNKLESIAHNYSQFGFKFDCQPIRMRREETCSYVYAPDTVGREDDQEKIVRMLLDPNVQRDVSCLSIVGIGGLGKTTLAQLVYNDSRIKEHFSLRVWTCVSDQDLKRLDVKATLCKILHSATSVNHEHLALDPLVKKLRQELEEKKYLLVLDDLWNENRIQWRELVKYLMSDVRGSWILVTTRSEETATIVEDERIYKLKGLSVEESWCLFEMAAFGQRYGRQYPSDLVEIGRDIVKRCANVPLAIKVVGSLLYDQGKDNWLRFQKAELGRLKDDKNDGIGPILKFSYYHLDPPLKACFSYCALFPKDHVVDKEMLIRLWMAQDYIVSQEGQSVEDVGEEYFSILAKRCFFQDLIKDEFGKIISCKIHDSMHDIAQEVSGREVCATNFAEKILDNKTRHVSYFRMGVTVDFQFPETKIRTCLSIGRGISVDMLLRNWKCLRTLDLSNRGIKSLPSELVKLLHLRYLDLSYNELQLLPNSFSKLHNLQTLSLRGCFNLKELPEDLPELAKLRVLDIYGCRALNSMPQGLGKLTGLHKMPWFIAGDKNSSSKRSIVNQMEELKALENLEGSLDIEIFENAAYAKENVREGGYIRNKEHLNGLGLQFSRGLNKMAKDEEGLLLEDLQPHCNLRELRLSDYGGMSMPSWAKENELATFLPNLINLELCDCPGLQHLPSLGKLRNLKSLKVISLCDLEYIENTSSKAIISDGIIPASELAASFPSLQELTLRDLKKLKGWWRDDDDIIDCDINEGQQHLLTSFPSLSKLTFDGCPHFTCVITCPNVEELQLYEKLSEKLRIMIPVESGNSKLRIVRSTNSGNLKSILPTKAFQCVHGMEIWCDQEMESLSEVEEVFCSCSSLRQLDISDCEKLKSVSGGLEYLTALESLSLNKLASLSLSKAGEGEGEKEEEDEMPWRCLRHNLRSLTLTGLPKIVSLPKGMCYLTALESLHVFGCDGLESLSNGGEREGEGEENDGMPWRFLHQRLRSLRLTNLPKLVNLPKGMRYLRALQSLTISGCPALESLPESMRELTSLTSLEIYYSSDSLKERCRKNTGEDWPNIQHIHHIDIW